MRRFFTALVFGLLATSNSWAEVNTSSQLVQAVANHPATVKSTSSVWTLHTLRLVNAENTTIGIAVMHARTTTTIDIAVSNPAGLGGDLCKLGFLDFGLSGRPSPVSFETCGSEWSISEKEEHVHFFLNNGKELAKKFFDESLALAQEKK